LPRRKENDKEQTHTRQTKNIKMQNLINWSLMVIRVIIQNKTKEKTINKILRPLQEPRKSKKINKLQKTKIFYGMQKPKTF
jgi:hypothetical protein